jgi:hypothetical protein
MLLELLQHHQDIFLAAIWPLICARNAASLFAVAASCRQLWTFLAAEVPLLRHYVRMRGCLLQISAINIIYSKYATLREHNNKFHMISYWDNFRRNTPVISHMSDFVYVIHSFIDSSERIIYHRNDNNNANIINITTKRTIDYAVHVHIVGAIPQWLQKYIKCEYVMVTMLSPHCHVFAGE